MIRVKALSVIRTVDSTGRVVIPSEIRGTLGFSEGSHVELSVDKEGEIILRKYEPVCCFCRDHKSSNMRRYKNKLVCTDCIQKLQEVL